MEENDQAIRCAVEQIRRDMPSVEVIEASLYKKVEPFGDWLGLSVQAVRWYVEVKVRNLNDETHTMAFYRVWHSFDTGELKVMRVPLVI